MGVHLKKTKLLWLRGDKAQSDNICSPKHLTCDHGGTWTTTAGRLAHSSWWKLCPGSLPLYPQCTFGHRLHIKNNKVSSWQLSLTPISAESRQSYLSFRRGHSWRSSSPLRCSRLPPRADAYRWRPDASRSWRLWRGSTENLSSVSCRIAQFWVSNICWWHNIVKNISRSAAVGA